MNKTNVLMILFIILGLSSCCEYFSDCLELESCNVNSDCSSKMNACYDGKCYNSPCRYEEPDCSKGVCVAGSDMQNSSSYDPGYECKCDENAVNYSGKCVPTCSGFSQECRDFGININQCNMALGHCDIKCQGEGSCEEGRYCSSGGACRPIINYCNTDNDCVNNTENKTICNTEKNLCEEAIITSIKSEYLEEYTNIACQKYFECNPSIDYEEYSGAYTSLENCKEELYIAVENTLDSIMCDMYDSNYANEIISCTDEYVCSETEGIDDGFGNCIYKYFMGMCKDLEGKNEAATKLANVYCDHLFVCNNANALERYEDLEDCKNHAANDIYVGYMYDDCLYYKKELYDDFITCRKGLVCGYSLDDACQDEFYLTCNDED